jgi:hypothetical protein
MLMSSLRRWDLSLRAAIVLFIVPFLGAGIVAAAHLAGFKVWHFIDQEDGLVESLQFVGLLLASFCGLATAWHLFRQASPVPAALYFLLGLGLFFIAGEEIAWGQRLLQFDTPGSLAEVNEKGELSLHNVESITELFNVGKFLAGLYGVLGWLVLPGLGPTAERWRLDLYVVPWFLSSAFLLIVVQRVLRWTILSKSVPRGYGELDEAFFVFGVTAFVVLTWRRLHRTTASRGAGTEASVVPN